MTAQGDALGNRAKSHRSPERALQPCPAGSLRICCALAGPSGTATPRPKAMPWA